MPRVVVTAHVEDTVKWEAGFRTRGELFKSLTVTAPVVFAINEGNDIAVCCEPGDLDTFMNGMASSAVADAMDADGINRETVKTYVLDKEFQP